MFDYYTNPTEIEIFGERVVEMIVNGTIKVSIGQRYALRNVAQAHRDLEARKTTGSTVLLPEMH
jgi:NADPH2:quinone reductase